LREAAWVLAVSTSTLSGWNQGFDDNMMLLKVADNRGKASKVTIEVVRCVCEKARALIQRAKRIRLKQFTEKLKKEDGIDLSSKTVNEILIANDLASAQSRKKRPKFYQSLCQKIPNGLLSLDGSDFIIFIDNMPFTFSVELAVDVASFTHTAFSIADTETTQQVISVLEAHRQKWGTPIGIVCDHRSANLSEDAIDYIKAEGIELVAAGPRNPKGNGTDEGAFSQMKKALGTIHIDMSSPKALAKSVLDSLISVYVYMRNRLCLHNKNVVPAEQMTIPVSEDQRNGQRQQLKDHKKAKAGGQENQLKLDHLKWVIDRYRFELEPAVLKRAQYSIKSYGIEAINETQKAFVKATNRNADRCNISYFFGILKNIQLQRDEEAIRQYCRNRYNYLLMLDMQRRQDEQQQPASIDDIIGMLEKAVTKKSRIVKELAIRKVRDWTLELMKNYSYIGSLKKKLSDALGKLNHLNLEQKQKAWELLDQFLNPKSAEESVTLSS
jgi:transposase